LWRLGKYDEAQNTITEALAGGSDRKDGSPTGKLLAEVTWSQAADGIEPQEFFSSAVLAKKLWTWQVTSTKR
jgi:hypothetical protein